jgi:hypothetical protein
LAANYSIWSKCKSVISQSSCDYQTSKLGCATIVVECNKCVLLLLISS